MIVYRHSLDKADVVQFYATQQEAIRAFQGTERDSLPSRIVKLDVPTDKEGLVMALNLALAHPDHWSGEIIRRSKP